MDVTSDRTKADTTYSKCATIDTPLSEYLSCIVQVIPFQRPHTKGVAVRMLMLRLETKSQNCTSLRILLCKQLPNTLQHWRSHTLQVLPLLFQQYRLVLKNHIYEEEIKPLLLDVAQDTKVNTEALIEEYVQRFQTLDASNEIPKQIEEQKKRKDLALKKKSKLLEYNVTGAISDTDFITMNKKMCPVHPSKVERKNRNAPGHTQIVHYIAAISV